MSTLTSRDVTTVHREIALPIPTVWGELTKAIAYVERELGDAVRWDDACAVVATDDELIFRWVKKTPEVTA